MQIAVFSDSHDHLARIEQALEQVRARGITQILHLGDYCSPFAVELLAKGGIPVTGVWGNNDGDKLNAIRMAEAYGTFDVAGGDFREVELDGLRLFLTHYPEIGRIAALSGQYDAVFHGHNHRMSQELLTVGNGAKVLLANPGELCGTRFGTASFGIFDTHSRGFEYLTLG